MVRSRAANASATNARRCSARAVSRSIAATMKACGDVPTPAATAAMRCFNSAGSFRVVAGMVDPPSRYYPSITPRRSAASRTPERALRGRRRLWAGGGAAARDLRAMCSLRPGGAGGQHAGDQALRAVRTAVTVEHLEPAARGFLPEQHRLALLSYAR